MTNVELDALRNGPFAVHVASAGDRWDLIAYRYYGDATRYEILVAANHDIPIVPVLEAGWHILVPIVDDSADAAEPSNDDLPPWKRAS